jgi:hypothetical protein
MNGKLKVQGLGYRVQGAAGKEWGQQTRTGRCNLKNLYVTPNPAPRTLNYYYAMTGSRSLTETTREQPGSSMVMP